MIFRQLFDQVSGTYSYLIASRRGVQFHPLGVRQFQRIGDEIDPLRGCGFCPGYRLVEIGA